MAGAGAVIGDTTLILKSMTDIDGNLVTMTSFGTIAFGTLEPGNGTLEEQICFTGVTQNANGTATLTGVKSVTFASPYTQTSGLLKTHAGATTFVISNTSGFYDELTSKNDDETIAGTWTFTAPNYPQIDVAATLPTADAQFATKKYVDGVAVSGAPNANLTTKGIVQLPTQAQVDAKTSVGSTAANLALTPDKQRSTLLSDYVVDTGTANVIVITPSPAITAYTTGQQFSLKMANTITSPTVSLNVSGLGAKSVIRNSLTSPVVGDLISGQIVVLEYDGTNFQITSPLADIVAPTGTPVQGDVLYNTGTSWVRLAAGTTPFVLTTGGAGGNPTWAANFSTTRGVIADNTNVTTSGGGGTNTDTTVTHGYGKLPPVLVISCNIFAASNSSTLAFSGILNMAMDGSRNMLWSHAMQWISGAAALAGSSMGVSSLLTPSYSVASTGATGSENITVSITAITATTFTFRINGVLTGSDPGSSTVTNIVWSIFG